MVSITPLLRFRLVELTAFPIAVDASVGGWVVPTRLESTRLGRPSDPALLVALLCSEAGSWITGQVYPVDGGYSSAL